MDPSHQGKLSITGKGKEDVDSTAGGSWRRPFLGVVSVGALLVISALISTTRGLFKLHAVFRVLEIR